MHFLLINSEYPPVGGGAGNASANIARKIVQFGHKVTVLTSRYGLLQNEEVQEGVRIVRVPALRRKPDRSGALEQTVFMLVAFIWSIPIIRKLKPDVMLAFFGVPSGAVALGFKTMFRIPYLVSLRGGDVPGFRPYDFALYHRLIGPLVHVVWRKAAAVVANSDGLRGLAQAFDRKVPIMVIPNGVSTSRYAATIRQWEPARLLIVGRVVYQKGIDLLLEALAGIAQMEWDLSIAGDGPQRESLEETAHSLGINNRIKFLGWQSKSALVECYRRANLFVYPSRHEGMPNVVLEAMASGLPVIASEIAGNEELVLPGETGLLVPPENIEDLRAAIRELILDHQRRKIMGAAAQKRVEEQYTWAGTAQQYLELLNTALEKN
jgi:glycosyltransferase involved in cell wall biosynthesis